MISGYNCIIKDGRAYGCGMWLPYYIKVDNYYNSVEWLTQLGDINNIRQIIGDNTILIVLLENGDVYYASNSDSILKYSSSFIKLPLSDIKQVCINNNISYDNIFALSNDNIGYTIGYNNYGKCAIDRDYGYTQSEFVKIAILDLKQISSGANHTILLTNSGEVYICGSNNYGQLGVSNVEYRNELKKLDLPFIKSIHAGKNSSFFISLSGDVYDCGNSNKGNMFGIENVDKVMDIIKIECLHDIKQVSSSNDDNVLYLTNDGNVYGAGDSEQLGLGRYKDIKGIVQLPINNIKQVLSNSLSTMLLDYDDNIYVCGTNNDFRLRMGLNVNLSTPTLLNSIETRSYKNYRFKKHNEIFKFNSEKK